MKKLSSPTPADNPLRIIPYNQLKQMAPAELLQTAAEMLKYLDPPGAPGLWAIALINFQAIDALREMRENQQTKLKFAG